MECASRKAFDEFVIVRKEESLQPIFWRYQVVVVAIAKHIDCHFFLLEGPYRHTKFE